MAIMTGPEQLKDWMRKRGFNQSETARYLGWGEVYLSRLMTGAQGIGLDYAVHLHRLTGIPVEAWTSNQVDEPEKAAAASGSKRKLA